MVAWHFPKVIQAFEDAGVDVRRIYWNYYDALDDGEEDEGPDLIIQAVDGPKHVKAVTVNAEGDITVELE